MKKFVKIIAIVLAFVLLVGCSESGGKKQIDLTMNETETAIAQNLKVLYENASEDNISSAVFNATDNVLTVLSKTLADVLTEKTAETILVK